MFLNTEIFSPVDAKPLTTTLYRLTDMDSLPLVLIGGKPISPSNIAGAVGDELRDRLTSAGVHVPTADDLARRGKHGKKNRSN